MASSAEKGSSRSVTSAPMAEESLPFYTLLVPVMLAARFDPVVAASTVLLGAGIGTLGSTINPLPR